MRRAVLLVCVLAAATAPASAHRLDEYLQATLVTIERDRVDLDVALTPGVAIAPQVLALIDRDGDDRISPDEEIAYATAVMAAISLEVDGRGQAVTLTGRRFPALDEMRQGVGTIRLNASVRVPRAAAGQHEVVYRNVHRPELGVYLANALVPADPAIQIAHQQRDVQQRELRIQYRVAGDAQHPWALAASAGAATLLTMLVWRRRHAR